MPVTAIITKHHKQPVITKNNDLLKQFLTRFDQFEHGVA